MAKKVDLRNIDVVRNEGDRIEVPHGMELDDVIRSLILKKEQEEEVVSVNAEIDVYPTDGAHALMLSLKRKFGWQRMVATPGFFGATPPMMLDVDVGPNGESIQVPWGRMEIPGIDGFLQTGATTKDGRWIFQLGGQVKRKHEGKVKEIVDLVRQTAREESIYRSKAIRVTFESEGPDGMPAPPPTFMDLSGDLELVFSDDLMRQVSANLFTPIVARDAAKRAGVPTKRGVLLAGPYGTGKTQTAHVAAAKATNAGFTFIYLDNVAELGKAIRFASHYEPAVIFAEDLDRAAENRDNTTNEIMNVIDGIESKNSEIFVVLTTNHVEKIHPAMLRPGRLDQVIYVNPPDAKAAEKLVRVYARHTLEEGADLTEVGKALSGEIPAVIREVVESAKLYRLDAAITAGESVDGELSIRPQDLVDAARGMEEQRRLLTPTPEDRRSDIERAADRLGSHLTDGVTRLMLGRGVERDEQDVEELDEWAETHRLVAGTDEE